MDHIRQALDRAKETVSAEKPQDAAQVAIKEKAGDVLRAPKLSAESVPPIVTGTSLWGRDVVLNNAQLVANRLVSQDVTDLRSRTFDILRTQVLQSMDKEAWQILGVTSPTPACGKSVIAANLALSMARQPGREVLLVDLDLQKPQVANLFGMKCDRGLMEVLEGRASLSQSIIRASIRNKHLHILPCVKSTIHSSEWMASAALAAMFSDIRRDYKSHTVIVDLPPILTSDDVIAVLPQLDCALFVAAVGRSTLAEIKSCNKHLDTTPILQVIVNKAPDMPTQTYYYSG